ncbi:hypothetical protein H4R33_004475 [Dimargaris cristalligena]|uniref:GPN-loop GTPase 2 n=1 Tax=Dimargaris cristalligena TaxID=215637 RepID=A0A4P9ZVC9_9FUNG|nr:hypothetical protein H4R33_004475 [Dimargaris cristalligena]RKP37576.1 GPN-loop GTPase [Dimargaris cristalligena]|eukprot:RKP37576.1 GPN-loop GTPase [Dimargaris cristalligena]
MPFAQLVIGPPGAGKTTYCHGMQQFLTALGREVILVNLDPANDHLPYDCAIDLTELITLEDTMDELGLGPNGGLIYCMEYLADHMDWLLGRLAEYSPQAYYIFDCPGQVELYTHHPQFRDQVIGQLIKQRDFRFAAVNLVDAHHCTDAAKFISVLLLSLKTMVWLELPHVNVLSKIDLIQSYGNLDFNLEYYTEVHDLSYLLDRLNAGAFTKRYHKLNEALCELIEDYNLVGFQTLCIEDKNSVMAVLSAIDKANGCVFGGLEAGNNKIMEISVKTDFNQDVSRVQEQYIDFPELYKNSKMDEDE